MSFDLMFEILCKSTAISALAAAIVWLMRGRSPAERAWVAHVGLLLTLLTPLLVLRGPDLPVVTPWSAETAIAYESAADAMTDPVFDALAEAPVRIDANLPYIAPEMVVFAIYGIIALLLIVGLGVAVSRLFVLQRRAQVLTDPAWLSALAHAQRRMGFKQGTALLVSDDLGSPVSWGFLRPTILLNPNAVNTPAQAEAVIAHELAHVMRLDWANLMIARLATAVFWFNPLVWLLARQGHQYREEAADDAVLRGKVAGPDYASLLVGIARHENQGALLAANGVAPGGKDSLKRRLTRVLDAKARRAPTRPAWVAASSLAAIAVVAPLAAFTPVDRPAVAPSPSAAASPPALPSEASSSIATRITPAIAAAVAAPIASATAEAVADAEVGPPAVVGPSWAPRIISGGDKLSGPAREAVDDLLLQMSIHGVTPEWAQSLGRVNPNLRRLTGEQLIGLAVHRVNAEWLSELEELGYHDLDYDTVVAFAVHRVTPAYIESLAEAGYRDLPAQRLIDLRVHRVSADYIRRLERGGLRLGPSTGSDEAADADNDPTPPSTPPPMRTPTIRVKPAT